MIDSKIIISLLGGNGDISNHTYSEKKAIIIQICNSLGLRYETNPIHIYKRHDVGGEFIYVTKEGCAQLRHIYNININNIYVPKIINNVLIVKASGENIYGRKSTELGSIFLSKEIKDEKLSWAILTATTKAKRRLTLCLSGLGLLADIEATELGEAIVFCEEKKPIIVDTEKEKIDFTKIIKLNE